LIRILCSLDFKNKPLFISETPDGIKYCERINFYDSLLWYLDPNHNNAIINKIKQNIKPNFVYFDIGANVSMIAIKIAMHVKDNGSVYAFEPVPETCQRAEATIAINGLTNISLFQLALGDSESKISFNFPYGHSGGASALPLHADSVLSKQNCDTINVRCTTLDSFVEERKIPHVDLMKIDVEGYEANVLRGAQKIIARDGPSFLYEYNDCAAAAGWSCEDIEKIIEETGRKYKYSVLHQNGELTEYPPKDGEDVDIFAECVE